MAQQNKVAVNLEQDFTDEQKAQARANIGAAAASDIPSDIPSIIRKDTYSGGTEYDLSTLLLDRQGASTSVLKSGATNFGSTVPAPSLSSDEGKIPVAYYRDNRAYFLLEKKNYVPDSNSTDKSKVLTVNDSGVPVWANPATELPPYTASTVGQALFINSSGDPIWAPVPSYYAGDGIRMHVDAMGDTEVSWDYTVGRNLHINQNNAIQTNFPGGIYDAPITMSNDFTRLTGAKFAGAYMLACRHNPNDTYEIAIVYTASGSTSTITFIGTESVIGINNNLTINPAAYISESSYYTPTQRFGGNMSTVFNPTIHKAIIYQGLAQIGPTSNTQIAIWQDNGDIKISFTSIEVGKAGSTL